MKKHMLILMFVLFINSVFADSADRYDLNYRGQVTVCIQNLYAEINDLSNVIQIIRINADPSSDDQITRLCLQEIAKTDFDCDFLTEVDRKIFFFCRDLCVYRILLLEDSAMYQNNLSEGFVTLLNSRLDFIKATFFENAETVSNRLAIYFLIDLCDVESVALDLFLRL